MENKSIKNVMIIKSNKDLFFRQYNNVYPFFNNKQNFLFKLFNKMNSSFVKFFFGDWKKEIRLNDTVILFDNGYSNIIPKYIKGKNKNIKVVFWFWNSIKEYKDNNQNKIIDDILNNKYIDEIWTYNRFEAKEYNLKYNPQFYQKCFELENEPVDDVLFLGREKGRNDNLMNLNNIFNENKIKSNIIIVKNEKDKISYDDYLRLLSKSKCVLDYSFTIPCGLSLRPLEALFYEKKLITNNPDIKNYDFYNPNNIFILGEDKIENLKSFLDKPYEKVNQDIIDYYSFESWLDRIANMKGKG